MKAAYRALQDTHLCLQTAGGTLQSLHSSEFGKDFLNIAVYGLKCSSDSFGHKVTPFYRAAKGSRSIPSGRMLNRESPRYSTPRDGDYSRGLGHPFLQGKQSRQKVTGATR